MIRHDGGVWRTLGTSYLEYGAHLAEVRSGAQKPEGQNWTHVFRDGIEMGNKTIGNLSNKHKHDVWSDSRHGLRDMFCFSHSPLTISFWLLAQTNML